MSTQRKGYFIDLDHKHLPAISWCWKDIQFCTHIIANPSYAFFFSQKATSFYVTFLPLFFLPCQIYNSIICNRNFENWNNLSSTYVADMRTESTPSDTDGLIISALRKLFFLIVHKRVWWQLLIPGSMVLFNAYT